MPQSWALGLSIGSCKLTTEKVSKINESISETPHQEHYSQEYSIRKEEMQERRKLLYLAATFSLCLCALVITAITNQNLYAIDGNTLNFINQAFNAFILLLIPFLFGSLGAFARVLIAGLKVSKSVTLIMSSGLMASFSWIGIKSGILLALITPHIEKNGVNVSQIQMGYDTHFYSMILVAIIVGMFSSNIYIFINQKVEQITLQKQTKTEANDNPNK